MTARDRIIIVVVLVAAALGGFWFVGLAPKRKEASDLKSQVAVAQQQLVAAQQTASAARTAKSSYQKDYAELASLGKAVTKSDALPSLVYQLQAASHDARIGFQSLKVAGGGTQASAQTPAAAAAPAASTSGAGASSGSTSTPPSTSSSSTAAAAPATQVASATLPPGAAVGSAGFPTMPFSFVFNGTFFDMEQFLHDVQRFVRVSGDRVDVTGRLLSVDGFALTAGPKGFPDVKASISATAYLMSPDDAATTTTAPQAAAVTSASSTSSAGTPTAAVTGGLR